MKVVISLGGSILSITDPKFIGELAEMLKKASKEVILYIITGGGNIARTYINAARFFTNQEEKLDEIGILATRMNALLLASALNFSFDIPLSVDEAAKHQSSIVMGGTEPGQSTDAVGAGIALRVDADKFIIATNVNGVYTADPKIDRSAKKYDSIHIDELIKLCDKKWQAGKNIVIDGEACKIIRKGGIKTIVLNGKDLKSLWNAIFDKKFNGTIIEV